MSGRFRLTSQRIKLSENDVERACLDLLRYRRLYPLRQQSGRFKTSDGRWIRVGVPGIPDYVIPKFFVETKAPGGILSDVQRAKIYELHKHWDIETAVVESVEELIEWLEKRAGKTTGP